MLCSLGEVYNVGNVEGITFKDWVETCMQACERKVKLLSFPYQSTNYKCKDFFPFDDYSYVLDTQKIRKYYEPKISMLAGLKRSLSWYIDNKDAITNRYERMQNSDKILKEMGYNI